MAEKLWYRAHRRNDAVSIALDKHPETTDVLIIDSFYLGQTSALEHLIQRYSNMKQDVCLGPAIWSKLRTNLSQVLHSQARFYDAWSSPELRWCPYGWKPDRDMLTSQEHTPLPGLYQVSSIGGCYLFPRHVWNKGARYRVPDDLHGCEHNGFHESYPLRKYVDFNVNMWRVKRYGLVHCFRCSMGNWMRTRK